jgi:hypothetical protein
MCPYSNAHHALTGRRMSRQADGGAARASPAPAIELLNVSRAPFGGGERSQQPNERMGIAAAPFSGGKRSETERSVR